MTPLCPAIHCIFLLTCTLSRIKVRHGARRAGAVLLQLCVLAAPNADDVSVVIPVLLSNPLRLCLPDIWRNIWLAFGCVRAHTARATPLGVGTIAAYAR